MFCTYEFLSWVQDISACQQYLVIIFDLKIGLSNDNLIILVFNNNWFQWSVVISNGQVWRYNWNVSMWPLYCKKTWPPTDSGLPIPICFTCTLVARPRDKSYPVWPSSGTTKTPESEISGPYAVYTLFLLFLNCICCL